MKVSTVTVRGVTRYRLDYIENGERKRKLCGSRAEADLEAKTLKKDSSQVGEGWLAIPTEDRRQLIALWEKTGGNLASVDMARTDARTITQAIAELIAAKKAAGRDDYYRKCLLQVLNQFAVGRKSLRVDRVTIGDVESFLDSKRLASRSTLRARLSTLFNFCVRRGYCLKNPCAQLEPVTYHKPPPQVFTPAQLKMCLEWLTVNPKGFTWFVLTALCGLRPEEAQRTPRKKIQIKDGHIIVDVQTTKVRQRRVVTPMVEAMQWLRISLNLGGKTPINEPFKRRLIKKLRKLLGFKAWPKDITRHTAASIWLARIKSAAEVAEQLGNSERVLKRDYKALVTAKQLESYLTAMQTMRLPKSMNPKLIEKPHLVELAANEKGQQ